MEGYSNLYNAINDLKEDAPSRRFKTICSHSNENFIGFKAADKFIIEPKLSKSLTIESLEKLTEFIIENIKKHSVNLIIPSRRQKQLGIILKENILNIQGILEENNCKIVLTSYNPEIIDILNNKLKFYDYLKEFNLKQESYFQFNIPDYVGYSTHPDKIDNIFELSKNNEIFKSLNDEVVFCTKPTIGVYGSGFFIFDNEENDAYNRLNLKTKISMGEFVKNIKLLKNQNHENDMLLMEFLPNHEYSADCVAINGELMGISVREKIDGQSYQIMQVHKEIYEQTLELVKLFKLNGMFNVQFKNDKNNKPYILEINTRLSGKSYYATFYGVNLTRIMCNILCGYNSIEEYKNLFEQINLNKESLRVNSYYKTVDLLF